jgi:hypothetical protein
MTVSHIHIGWIKSVWAPWDAVDGHMGTPLCHWCIVQVGVNFRKIGVWLRLYDVVQLWLRQTPRDCIPHPYWIHKVFEHLEMLWMGIWLHPYTVMPVQVGVDFQKNWGMSKSEWCCGVMVEAANPHWLHPTTMAYICIVFEHLEMLWMGMLVHPYSYIFILHVQVGGIWGEMGMAEPEWLCGVMVEAPNPNPQCQWLYPASILDE